MRRQIYTYIGLCASILILFQAYAQAQTLSDNRAGLLLGEPVFRRAIALGDNGYAEEAIEEFNKIGRNHIGTEIEATAIYGEALELEVWSSKVTRDGNLTRGLELKERSLAKWRELASKWPQTNYWFASQLHLRESYEDVDDLLVEIGGVRRADVRSGAVTRMEASDIPPQYYGYVEDLYRYGGNGREEELRFLLFVRQSFPQSSIFDLKYFYLKDGESDDDTGDLTPPQISVASPAAGAVVSPTQAKLDFTTRDGDITARQVELRNSSVELDGVDILEACTIESTIDPEGDYFETLRLTFTPPSPLSPGTHEYRIMLKEATDVGLQTELVIPFTVSDSPAASSQSISASRDALIDNLDANGNEGANGILALDRLLGRQSRSLVAFDLADVDVNAVTKATLVLSIHKEERILGCGPGENIWVQALSMPWVEGNGKTYKVLPLTARRRGTGSGATWQRDTDTNIGNLIANGGYAWKGGQSAVMPRTAPAVKAQDHMLGTIEFNVTDDVINGAPHGWLIRKQHENLASRISFYSKEGAATAGNPDLAPRLILEYGDSMSKTALPWQVVAAACRQHFGAPRLKAIASNGETSGLREYLQRHEPIAYLGERLLASFSPLPDLPARLVYRTWLRGELSLV